MKETDVLKVDFFPRRIKFPTVTNQDYLRQTAEDMLTLLTPSTATNSQNPLLYGKPMLNAYHEVATILRQAVSLPSPPVMPVVLPRVSGQIAALPRVQPLTHHHYPPRVDTS